MQRIAVKVERVTYTNAQTGFVVLRGLSGKQNVTTVGILPDAMMNTNFVGTEYEMEGDWERSKYGLQFSFVRGRLLTNELYYFLTKIVKGLGEKLVRELLDHYGDNRLLEILENQPEVLLEFKGIKEKKLLKIKASWEKQKELRVLSAYLTPHGITTNLLIRIYNYYGNTAIQKIQENPYCLTDVRGIGFKTADSVAQKLGTAFASPFRVQAAIRHVMVNTAEEQGHTRLPISGLYDNIRELLNTDTEQIDDDSLSSAMNTLAGMGEIVIEDDTASLASYRYMETWLLSFFKERSLGTDKPLASLENAEAYIKTTQEKMKFNFSNEQRDIILRIALGQNRVYGLAGYAGTGKSTVSKAILDFLAENFCKRDEIVCCAFTGMASVRIKKLTGYPSFTIHTLLKYSGDNKFEYNKDNPLPQKVVLLDEASMVNLPIFYRLCQAVGKDTIFIMVGDPAQLPPIGAGNVFGDILEKPFMEKTVLKTIFRQSQDSVLVHFANIIRQGEVPDAYEANYLDFAFLSQDIPGYFSLKKQLPEEEMKKLRDDNNEKIRDRLIAIATDMFVQLAYPTWDFQVLVPMRKGILGAESLNPLLQNVFNRNGANEVDMSGIRIRERDKVVHLQNKDMETTEYTPSIFKNTDMDKVYFQRQRIFNGSVGIVMKIDQEDEKFYVLYPGNTIVRYEFDHIKDLIDLAYCLTVHKAQGSQYKYVAIPLSNSQFMMLNNKWFYTAITRAEKKVILIGQDYAFKRACTNMDAMQRLTYLGLI